MKYRVIAALPLLACATAAFAQSAVTVYGSMDLSMPWISNVKGQRLTRLDSAIDQPDYWGLRGSEDLGGGMKATFQLESAISSDAGTSGNATSFFNRGATVALQGRLGSLKLGRQFDMPSGILSRWGNGYQLYSFYLYHPGNLDGMSTQFPVNNSVAYATPVMGGVQLSALYGFGEVAGDTRANSTYSLAGTYAGERLDMALAYTKARGRAFDIAGATGITRALQQDLTAGTALMLDTFEVLGIGGGYRLESLPVRVNTLITRSTLKKDGATAHLEAFDLGAAWQATPATTINVGYSFSRFEDTKWNQLHWGMRYALSKRTQLHASVAHQRARNGVAAMYAVGVASGSRQTVVSTGIHTSF